MRALGLLFSLTLSLALAACVGDGVDTPDPDDGTGVPDMGNGDDGDDGGDDGSGGGSGGGGSGSPDGGGGSPGALCAAPGAVGNAEGVGEYCTPGGGECDDNEGATYCTVDYEEGAPPFCTTPCFGDDDCGEGASCESQEGEPLDGCVPACVIEGGAP